MVRNRDADTDRKNYTANNDPIDNIQYRYIAYRHSHGDSWFAAYATRRSINLGGAVVHRGLVTALRRKRCPDKYDIDVQAISRAAFRRLRRLEKRVSWAQFRRCLG